MLGHHGGGTSTVCNGQGGHQAPGQFKSCRCRDRDSFARQQRRHVTCAVLRSPRSGGGGGGGRGGQMRPFRYPAPPGPDREPHSQRAGLSNSCLPGGWPASQAAGDGRQ
eukprot:COSAG01_NODE_2063_length_8512_cov_7.924284_10_plen_109_part_00